MKSRSLENIMLGAGFCCKIYLKTSCLAPVFVVKFISRFVLVKTLYWKKKLLLDLSSSSHAAPNAGADLGRGCRGAHPLPPEMTCGFLIQLLFWKKKTMWFIGVEEEQETSALPPKKILDPPL